MLFFALQRLCAAAGVPYLIAKADLVSCESDDLSAVKTDAESSAGDNLVRVLVMSFNVVRVKVTENLKRTLKSLGI